MHESIATKLNAKRTREQLLSVLAHSHVTIFTVDLRRRVTMLEGALIWNKTSDEDGDQSKWWIGQDMYDVFNRLTEDLPTGERPKWLKPIEGVLRGKISEDVMEHDLGRLINSLCESYLILTWCRRSMVPNSLPPNVL